MLGDLDYAVKHLSDFHFRIVPVRGDEGREAARDQKSSNGAADSGSIRNPNANASRNRDSVGTSTSSARSSVGAGVYAGKAKAPENAASHVHDKHHRVYGGEGGKHEEMQARVVATRIRQLDQSKVQTSRGPDSGKDGSGSRSRRKGRRGSLHQARGSVCLFVCVVCVVCCGYDQSTFSLSTAPSHACS